MKESLDFLKTLISAPGLSGYEAPVRGLIEPAWKPLVDELSVSHLGNLYGLRRGAGQQPRHRLLLAAHMDAIGLMVSEVFEGFLRLTSVGGVDLRVLPGQAVIVHGRKHLPGVIFQLPPHLRPPDSRDDTIRPEHLLVDVGLTPGEVQQLVRVGDLVSFAQSPLEMGERILAGHSLDNRASVVALTCCLQALQGRHLAWDLWVVATVQEEETLYGAATAAFEIRPDLAIAVDVTYGSSQGDPAHKTYALEAGPTLGLGPNVHPGLHRAFKEIAQRLEIPYQIEVMPRSSGTDAMAMQVAAQGIPTMVISIPLRYVHTPVEMVSHKDILRAGRLLAEFAAQLDETFLDKLAWEQ
ncbi:MAG: M20/M25/M40 family metallo-hydrolase [Anaerolineales bacterium]|nr:M20/M25/M40 family metallo-hydrolase [Anaerolineales bacterium]